MKKIILFFVLFSLILSMSCSKKPAADDFDRTYTMVFVPASEVEESTAFQSLMDIVSDLTGLKFNFISVTDYNAAVEAMRVRRADIAWFGATTYVIAAEIANAEAFAAGVPKGQEDAGYYTYFVVRKESPIQTLEDAKGSVLALNHIGSTSGDYIPQSELLKVGLDINNRDHFKQVFYAGSHDAALMIVANGRADICGIASHNYYDRIADGTVKADAVRVVHKSPKVPPAPLAYLSDLPQEIKDKIKNAVLDAHNHGEIGGWGGAMERYIEVTDKDFDIMRDVRNLVEGTRR